MNLHFSLEYRTVWGEQVAVELVERRKQGIKDTHYFSLDTRDGVQWMGDVALSARDIVTLEYTYAIMVDGHIVRREWNGAPRCYPVSEGQFRFADLWRDVPSHLHLLSAAYCHSVSHYKAQAVELVYFQQTMIFRVQASQLKRGQMLALLGSQPPLGAWDTRRYLRMQPIGAGEWMVCLSAAGLYLPFEYKYVAIDSASGELVAWEQGDNRLSPSGLMSQHQVTVIQDAEARLPHPHWRAAGVVVPVFALRSQQSQGVGDFSDLLRMAKWAKQTGMTVVQTLPVNDTTQTGTWADCYPYSCVSVHALHPMYADIRALPRVDDARYMQQFEAECLRLNSLSQIDYEGVNQLKHDYLHRLYAQLWPTLERDEGYQQFCHQNALWLVAYAVYCHHRDTCHTCQHSTWPLHAQYRADEVEAWAQAHRREVGYYMYVQYVLDQQLWHTATQARQMGVVLKGDIPIGVSPQSVETWTQPKLFHTDAQTGAPPDDFSASGQNWGFPTYNWTAMQHDGCAWWRERLSRMARYFDAYRIDHVLGFFRIWEIPMECVDALLGHFSLALPMSEEEIRQAGFPFDAQWHAQPLVNDEVLRQEFGPHATLARHYLTPLGPDRYQLLPQYATQRRVEEAFEGLQGEVQEKVKSGLRSLVANVLFVPDPRQPERYHPRIDAMHTSAFGQLSAQARQAFRRIHEHYFYHRHNQFWHREAMQKLPLLAEATHMLVCAEDLGMVPQCVAPVLNELHILSLEIESMPKQFGVRFGSVADNPYESVCTLFTHDMPTLRQWWEEDEECRQAYYSQVLHHSGTAPEVLSGQLAQQIVERQIQSGSMLCLLSVQDWLSVSERLRRPDAQAERINIPANPHHYWRYRMHIDIEQLQADEDFTRQISTMLMRGGRMERN